ncbi:MAG: hypothetical protein ACRERD_20465 [Candidatus Binatia bacterium]
MGDSEYRSGILDLYRLTLGEARVIKRNTGLTLSDWRLGLITWGREDPDVLAGLLYVLKTRAGEHVLWADLDAVNAQDIINGLELEESDAAEIQQVTE